MSNGMEDKKQTRAERIGRLAELMTRNRYDPERLAAFKRAVSGKTRCPECDEVNPAGQETCDSCGAELFPDLSKKERKASAE